MQSIPDIPLLTKIEEHQLAARIRNGDKDAKELLIISNLRLVVKIARSYSSKCNIPLIDLIGEGNLGLMRAAELFSEEYDVRFATYAVHWIKNFLRTAVFKKNHHIMIPPDIYLLTLKWIAAVKKLSHDFQNPTDEQILAESGIKPSLIDHIKDAIASLHMFNNNGNDEFDLMSIIADHRGGDDTQHNDEFNPLIGIIEGLPLREKSVIKMRYGLDQEALNLKAIGEALGISHERVRQIESSALRRLKMRLTRKPKRNQM